MRGPIQNSIWEEFKPITSQVQRKFQFELTSPAFGGGVESWHFDKDAPIRTQAIKGQLRFWWRTLQQENDYKTLLHRENELWGGIGSVNNKEVRRKSQIGLAVVDQRLSASDWHKVERKENNGKFAGLGNNILSNYVLFPIIDKVKDGSTEIHLLEKCTFNLVITYPQIYEEEILTTLKLWTLFGGVGARTRRGCGSVYCHELLKDFHSSDDLVSFLHKAVKGSSATFGASPYPILSGSKLFSATSPQKIDVTKFLDLYANFRQDRKPNSPHPGRSYWPEPDAIRRVLDTYAPLHEPVHPDQVWFPRAAFGLPILTRFNTHNGSGDPEGQIELVPQKKKRWPSPVILKVTKLSDNLWVKIMLVLNHKSPELSLKSSRGTKELQSSAKPDNQKGKIMINDPDHDKILKGRSIYQALAEHLKLGENL